MATSTPTLTTDERIDRLEDALCSLIRVLSGGDGRVFVNTPGARDKGLAVPRFYNDIAGERAI